MYGAITGMRFAGLFDGKIEPRRPAREEDCGVCQLPGRSLPGLEARLSEGYPQRGDGGSVDLMPIRFEGQKAYNYGFSGSPKKDGERVYWLV